jgi:hypothetical protein
MVIHRNDKFTSSSLISHVIMIMAYGVECNCFVKLNGGNIYGMYEL